MSKEQEYKELIKENLFNTLSSGFIPGMGIHKPGKVRDVHFTSDEIGQPIVMISSDRVSCFDNILSRQIPFKGKVLNLFSQWAFEQTKDIVGNAMIKSPHDNAVIQKTMNKINYEFVIRGYVWGSMAEDYENGKREFCGINLPDNLLRYQKLDQPLFTPATKAEYGDHDINVSFEYMAERLGKELSEKLRDISMKLYQRASDLARQKGFIFIDTKYEFGLDENNKIYLIDEANTPDSSRYCRVEEVQKFEKIKQEMQTDQYKNVTELLQAKPELKIKELSKQFVREVLIEKGYKGYGGSGTVPELDDNDVIETSWRYISLYEELTGNKFDFNTSKNIRADLLSSLEKEGLIKHGFTLILAGSDSDLPHIRSIQDELKKYNISSSAKICSAHKQPAACLKIIEEYNSSIEPVVIISIAGATDALSGVASFHSIHPVISCPPDKNNYISCIGNPPGSSNSLILNPKNVARHVAQILGQHSRKYHDIIKKENHEKIQKLEQANK